MQIHNTGDTPLFVFYLPADEASAKREKFQVDPGGFFDIDLQPGDSVKTRIATEITDPVPEVPQTPPEA